jgi:hypothetical protein
MTKMNTTNKLIVLSAVAVLMIAATTLAATANPASADRTNVCKQGCRSGQQNSGDTIANGGNFVGGDQNVGNED